MRDLLVTREIISRIQSLTQRIPDEAIQHQILSMLNRLAEDSDTALEPILSKNPDYRHRMDLYIRIGKSKTEAYTLAIRDLVNALLFQEELEKERRESTGEARTMRFQKEAAGRQRADKVPRPHANRIRKVTEDTLNQVKTWSDLRPLLQVFTKKTARSRLSAYQVPLMAIQLLLYRRQPSGRPTKAGSFRVGISNSGKARRSSKESQRKQPQLGKIA